MIMSWSKLVPYPLQHYHEQCPYGFCSGLNKKGVRGGLQWEGNERTYLNRCHLSSWVKHTDHLVLYNEKKDGKSDGMSSTLYLSGVEVVFVAFKPSKIQY